MAMRRVIGLMSGTSLDGVDAAMIETDGVDIAGFGPSVFVAYSEADQSILLAAVGLWPGEDAGLLAAAGAVIHDRHLAALAGLPTADLIGFHGQTLAHDPAQRRTHQLGDGAVLAQATGIRTVWDFRTADMANGGQGAPLVPFYHFALARRAGLRAPVAFLNIGGVANVTWVDPARERPEEPGALLAFDTGPGNAVLNDFIRLRTGAGYDDGGRIAAQGQVDNRLVAAWLHGGYFARKPPKSLDRNDFHRVLHDVAQMATADGAATLTAFAAQGMAAAAQHFPRAIAGLYVCGGGRRNSTLMAMLQDSLPMEVLPVEAAGLDGDMLEAQAFAWLAARLACGLPISAPDTTGCLTPTSGGKIADPPQS